MKIRAPQIMLMILMPIVTGAVSLHAEITSSLITPVPGLKTVLLSPENLTENQAAFEKTVNSIRATLADLNIESVASEQLRPILRKHRIRAIGRVNASDATLLQQETGADLLLTGSIDFCRKGNRIEFGVSLRLISPDDMIIRSAVSDASSGGGNGFFATGRIDNLDSLIHAVVTHAVEHLYVPLLERNKVNKVLPYRAVVFPFDNTTDDRRAGFIAANWMLTQLVEEGYDVVEPGVAFELTASDHYPVGGVDYQQLDKLRETMAVDFVVTGEIDRFRPARSSSPSSKPEFEFGARVINAATGQIMGVYSAELNGAETEVAFKLGHCHTLGGLLRRAFKDTIKHFQSRMKRYGLK